MPVINPLIPFIRRRRRRPAPITAPIALNLVAAEFVVDAQVTVQLTFDRPIDISAIAVGQITVIDGSDTLMHYAGEVVDSTPTPESVLILLGEAGSTSVGPVLLNASGTTGIVAVDDGAEWSGASGVVLPFP